MVLFSDLSVKTPDLRSVQQKIKIETGRFTIPKTPEDLRICDHYNQNSVKKELHI